MARKISTSEKEIEEHLLKWAGKKTLVQMATELFMSKSALKQRAKDLRISTELVDKKERREKVIEILKTFPGQKTSSEIAQLANVSASGVDYIARTLGLSYKKMEVKTKEEKPQLFFNERARENWLV